MLLDINFAAAGELAAPVRVTVVKSQRKNCTRAGACRAPASPRFQSVTFPHFGPFGAPWQGRPAGPVTRLCGPAEHPDRLALARISQGCCVILQVHALGPGRRGFAPFLAGLAASRPLRRGRGALLSRAAGCVTSPACLIEDLPWNMLFCPLSCRWRSKLALQSTLSCQLLKSQQTTIVQRYARCSCTI